MTAESAKNNDSYLQEQKSGIQYLREKIWTVHWVLQPAAQQRDSTCSADRNSGLSPNCIQSGKAERRLTHTRVQGIKVSACAFEPPTRCFFIEPRSQGVSCFASKPWVLRSEPWVGSVRSGSHPPSRRASCHCLSQASSRRLSFLDFCAFHGRGRSEFSGMLEMWG